MKPSAFPHDPEMSSSLCIFIIFVAILPINNVDSVQLAVNGPVTASLSENIVLRCHLSPRTSAENMEIKWFRSQNSSYVHLYQSGKEHLENQQPEYQRRTEFLTDGIGDGKIGLRILNVSFSDEGQYHCSVKNSSFHQEAILDVKVAATGSTPLISIESYQEKGIYLLCQSRGWYPKPEVLWRDSSGRHLTSLARQISQKNNGLFEVQNDILLTGSSNQPLTCVVRSILLNQEKGSSIHIADNVFPKILPWTFGLCVSLLVSLGLIIVILYMINKNRKLITELSWRKMVVPTERANVTLDPDTANHDLILSADQKNVIQGFMWHSLPDHPQRFDVERCVLGKEGFSSGRHYWEVEVGDKTSWDIGVAKESVNRKEAKVTVKPSNGFWAIWLRNGSEYKALDSPSKQLSPKAKPQKVGVYLDYEGGQVSFYDAVNMDHIFTFLDVFTERLYPMFSPGVNKDGLNGEPLRLLPPRV